MNTISYCTIGNVMQNFDKLHNWIQLGYYLVYNNSNEEFHLSISAKPHDSQPIYVALNSPILYNVIWPLGNRKIYVHIQIWLQYHCFVINTCTHAQPLQYHHEQQDLSGFKSITYSGYANLSQSKTWQIWAAIWLGFIKINNASICILSIWGRLSLNCRRHFSKVGRFVKKNW